MKIKNLTVKKAEKEVLKNINLELTDNTISVIMGANGCGKTTLANTIVGNPDCIVVSGEIVFGGMDLLKMETFEIALNGVYLSPQNPIEINGLSNAAFLKHAVNAKRKFLGQDEVDEFEFLKLLKEKAKEFYFEPKDYIRHSFNVGYSGGEKKRNEMLQISLLQPKLIILDEVDSGLDLDMFKKVKKFLLEYKENGGTILMVTHNPKFIENIGVDKVFLMKDGSVKKEGDSKLIDYVANHGFGDL